jgi:hypothetical protein
MANHLHLDMAEHLEAFHYHVGALALEQEFLAAKRQL